MRRHQDWQTRLDRAFRAMASRPFAYGSHDCCLAACDLVQAMTDEDPAADLRAYQDIEGARDLIRRHKGVAGLARYVGKRHGLEPVDPAYAQRGDVVVIRMPDVDDLGTQDVLGVVDLTGRFAWVAAAPAGWRAIGRNEHEWRRAWRIPS